VVCRKVIEHLLQFLIEIVFWIIICIRSWCMHNQHKVTPTTSHHYMWHAITISTLPTADTILWCIKNFVLNIFIYLFFHKKKYNPLHIHGACHNPPNLLCFSYYLYVNNNLKQKCTQIAIHVWFITLFSVCMLAVFFPLTNTVRNLVFGVCVGRLGVLLPAELPRSDVIAHSVL
jgi:hypothetical protein